MAGEKETGKARPRSRRGARSAIAVLTDFGVSGFYAGAMRGAILAVDREAVIADVTHGIRPFAVAEASFVLSVVFEYWARGTVFLAIVDPGVGGGRRNIVVLSRGRFVVGPDNGIVSDTAARFGVERAWEIDVTAATRIRRHAPQGRTFLGRDLFAPVAAYLSAGGDPSNVGTAIEDVRRLPLPRVEVRDNYVRGVSRYADDYGNLITNVSGDDLAAAFGAAPWRDVRALIGGAIETRGINDFFAEGARGELNVILDSWNLLEIAATEGRAEDRFGPGRPVGLELSRVRRGEESK